MVVGERVEGGRGREVIKAEEPQTKATHGKGPFSLPPG